MAPCRSQWLVGLVVVHMQAALAAASEAHKQFLASSRGVQNRFEHVVFIEVCWLALQIGTVLWFLQALVVYLLRLQKQHDDAHVSTDKISLADLQSKEVIGRGTFGIVELVQLKQNPNHTFALKRVDLKSAASAGQNDAIAATLSHRGIARVIKTFEDLRSSYTLTEFLDGGDLFNAIREIGTLDKQHVHFYMGSITLALEYLHNMNIIYRDLKPENVMLDSHGNPKLIDFGCSKQAREASTLVGTSEYMAPEVILGKTYTSSVDWWALGVMLHEFVVGPLPFGRDGQQRHEIFEEILHAPLQYLEFVSDELATSAIASLLQREPGQRLGAAGALEVKEHAYFTGLDWEALQHGRVPAPWTPKIQQATRPQENAANKV